jgi:hypothetical protein
MADRVLDVDDFLKQVNDPRFVPGVYNYCDRRCEQCRFADRCSLNAEKLREPGTAHETLTEGVERSATLAIKLMRRWCEREGIDFDAIQADPETQDAVEDEIRRMEEAKNDPLLKLAETYTSAATKIVERLSAAEPFNTWPPEVCEARDTIAWLALPVSTKTSRALSGAAVHPSGDECDDVQNDWNGSAKVARIDVAESRIAWETLLSAGGAAKDSPMREMIRLLEQIDAGLGERFPRAMEFVRPGFDEPERA